MSTDSGIPDYRGPDGTRRVTPIHYGEFLGSAGARRRYWARAFIGSRRFAGGKPKAGHDAIARLQGAGALRPLLTPKVHGPHPAARRHDLVALHGTLSAVVCLTCGARIRRAPLDARIRALNPNFDPEGRELRPDGDVDLDEADVAAFVLPRCLHCDSDLLKPDVVFFGESVP